MPFESGSHKVTRREFVRVGGSIAATAAFGKGWSRSDKPDPAFEHGEPLQEFHYGQVDFRAGIHEAQLEQTHSVLMSLSENSLLRPFRARAGFNAPGDELGGWYSSNGFVPGHSFGQWLSALSRYYAITGDEQTRAKVYRLVEGFQATVEPAGKFYKRYPTARGYSYDLLTLGLTEAHQFVRQPAALAALAATTKAVSKYLPGKAIAMAGKHICEPDEKCHDHTYVIPENQFIAWQQGGNDLHLKMAQQYLFNELFEPLAAGEDVLGGLHAYTHVNALCSAAKAYLVLGDEKYLRAAKNGFAFLDAQSYATGGWGPNERFVPVVTFDEEGRRVEIETLNDGLKMHTSFETPCGAWAHFKLTRYLLRITKDSRYGDSLERVMYNTVLGAKPLQRNGRAFYHSDYSPGARKAYFEGALNSGIAAEWPCCSGSLPQVAAEYRLCAYFQDADGVYVNLYIPSRLRWRQRGVEISLSQSGHYPVEDLVTLSVTSAQPISCVLRLRIPAWAKHPSIRINGQRISAAVEPGSFASLKREWKSGDRIELELPRSLELKPIDARYTDKVALVYGPLVLFAIASEMPRVTRRQLLAAQRSGPEREEWIVETADRHVRLLPWWAIKDETYFTYLSV